MVRLSQATAEDYVVMSVESVKGKPVELLSIWLELGCDQESNKIHEIKMMGFVAFGVAVFRFGIQALLLKYSFSVSSKNNKSFSWHILINYYRIIINLHFNRKQLQYFIHSFAICIAFKAIQINHLSFIFSFP